MSWHFTSIDARGAFGARNELHETLREYASDDSDVDAALLIFGELVGNVVRHAPGPVEINLTWDAENAVLLVRDFGPGFDWTGAHLPDPLAETGRGLFIVTQLAHQVAFERYADGMAARAWLPVARRPVAV